MVLKSMRIGIITTVALAAIASGASVWAGTPAPSPSPAKTTDVQPGIVPGKIQLTKEQQQKINAIRADRNKKISEVLNPEQRKKFNDAIKDEQKTKDALGAMNLSKEQKGKILAIAKKSSEEMIAVLTPQQKQQLQQLQSQTKKK